MLAKDFCTCTHADCSPRYVQDFSIEALWHLAFCGHWQFLMCFYWLDNKWAFSTCPVRSLMAILCPLLSTSVTSNLAMATLLSSSSGKKKKKVFKLKEIPVKECHVFYMMFYIWVFHTLQCEVLWLNIILLWNSLIIKIQVRNKIIKIGFGSLALPFQHLQCYKHSGSTSWVC